MKSIFNIGVLLRIPAALALLSGTAFAGEAKDIAACISAVKVHTGKALDEFNVVYEAAFFSFNTAKWPNVSCAVATGSVWSLVVDGKKLVVEGFGNEHAKREYERLFAETEKAVGILNTRENILWHRLDEAKQKLKAPKPNVADISARVDAGIKKAIGP